MSKHKILLTLLLCVFTQLVMAQERVVSGTVEDSMGPVMMANVTERDGNNRIVNAVQTDMMGNFSMPVKNPKNKIVISYVGAKTYSKVIGDQTVFNVKLEDEKTTLSEVTVRGKRTNSGGLNINKKEISLTQQSFDMAEVEGMAFTSADEALQGSIAGLDIVTNSGNLGSGTSMRLRGVSTFSGSAEPLIVVDDKIFEYDTNDIDIENADEEAFSSLLAVSVDDIASITVLKDAAATAIWGSKGANGVIQITTKRGSRGKPRISLGYKFTGTWMPSGYTLLNGDNYTMMLKEEFYNPTQSSSATATIREINYDKTWAEYPYWNRNTDWVDLVSQFGQQHEANVNITGGGQKATFRISASYNHQTGTVIKQEFDRLTTRLVLDYNVSDRIRFSTNFALTYSNNLKNYTLGSSKDNGSHNGLLPMALAMAPNMAVTRNDGTYYLMNPTGTNASGYLTPYDGNYTSEMMSSVLAIGNPIAYAHSSWQKEIAYSILPDFNLKYELLGTGNGQTRLTFNGRVYFDIYSYSKPTFLPASLLNNAPGAYSSENYNYSNNQESNQYKIGTRAELIFTPYFKNEDFYLTMLARYETVQSKRSIQSIGQSGLINGITSPTVLAYIRSMSNDPGTIKTADQNFIFNSHFSYKERYIVGFSLRGDGSSSFGPETPWFVSPSVSLRYNISDEKFFEPLRKTISMLGLRASWGITGSSSASTVSFYNTYTTSAGYYGTDPIITSSGMKIGDLVPQKKEGLNAGLNLGLFDDMIEADLNLYQETTRNLIMSGVPVPYSTGSTTLAYGNIGKMQNKGWELVIDGNKFIKRGKFSLSASFNIAQNTNKLLEMDQRVLDNLNSEYSATARGSSSILNRVVVDQPLCSIYGYEFKGVYQYSYDYLSNYNIKQRQIAQQNGTSWTAKDYEDWINSELDAGHTFPVATDADGHVVMTNNGTPQHIVYNYANGSSEYVFRGGDAMYEDLNHDGQINELDIKYLGNSLPKMNGGFSLTAQYGQWKLVARFTYRWGNKIVNVARMNLESMYGTENQCASVSWRWRQDGDVTLIPRALYDQGYNYQMSSRNVEDGSFLRFQNVQLSYSFPKNKLKKLGINNLSAYVTVNNLFCFTKYSGIDPEVGSGTYTPAKDGANTPRSKSVTASLSFSF